MPKPSPYLVSLDIGSTKVCALIAEADGAGKIDVIGKGTASHKGARKGAIIDVPATVDAIKRATEIDIVATPVVEKQLEGVWWELTHPELIHLNQILKATDAYDAGYLACKLWERAGAPGQPAKRGQGAQAWLAWFATHPTRAA